VQNSTLVQLCPLIIARGALLQATKELEAEERAAAEAEEAAAARAAAERTKRARLRVESARREAQRRREDFDGTFGDHNDDGGGGGGVDDEFAGGGRGRGLVRGNSGSSFDGRPSRPGLPRGTSGLSQASRASGASEGNRSDRSSGSQRSSEWSPGSERWTPSPDRGVASAKDRHAERTARAAAGGGAKRASQGNALSEHRKVKQFMALKVREHAARARHLLFDRCQGGGSDGGVCFSIGGCSSAVLRPSRGLRCDRASALQTCTSLKLLCALLHAHDALWRW